jgi:hypothetical protein
MADAASSPPDSQWSRPSNAGPDLMIALQSSLPVALIATPRGEFCVCRSDEMIAEVIRRNDQGFDHLPVIDASRSERKRIIGLLELVKFTDGGPAESSVRDHTVPLTEDNLIGADASILTFVKSADSNPCRLVLSGAEVTGLVSISDIQRLPVRAALFALITQFEMTMAAAIRRECSHLVDWKCRLSEGRLRKLMQKVGDEIAADNYVDDFCSRISPTKRRSSPGVLASSSAGANSRPTSRWRKGCETTSRMPTCMQRRARPPKACVQRFGRLRVGSSG